MNESLAAISANQFGNGLAITKFYVAFSDTNTEQNVRCPFTLGYKVLGGKLGNCAGHLISPVKNIIIMKLSYFKTIIYNININT